ncbi:MAG: protein-disulfide reductase DsbD [Gammaproteobacteria bacterium]|nr:protein-disulfide reductase DsbD [Gammaproteobacteria bacterium]
MKLYKWILLLTLASASAGVSLGALASAPTDSGKSTVADFFNNLGTKLGLPGSDGQTFLEPDAAYAFSATAINGGHAIAARWQVADGYYMYRDKFRFELVESNDVSLGAAQFPPSETKQDPNFGAVQVYHQDVEIVLPLLRTSAAPTAITLRVGYQGCAEAGFCYPPMTKTVSLQLPVASAANPLVGASANTGAPALTEQDQLARLLTGGSTAFALLTFFGLGLLLAFTPCVFPMVPILSSIIVGQGGMQNSRRAFMLSLVYVLAMAATYTIAGVAAGLFGSNLQAAFQSPWVLSSFSIVFVLLALSMFGLYKLQLPAALQTRLTRLSNSQQAGTLSGVALMGLFSALIVGPCVAAPLAAALIVIGQSGDAVLGGAALFTLSMGMGVPLLLVGTSLGKWLPRAGGWMSTVNAVFGVLLLALAVWLLERILPASVTLALWALLLIICAIYMGALERLQPEATGWRKLWKGVGVVMLIYGSLLAIGAASGGRDALQPLQNFAVAGADRAISAAALPALPFKQIKDLAQLQDEIMQARAAGKPVMLDFYADWCVSCKEMEKYTFSDPAVQQALSVAVLLQADVTADDATDRDLQKTLGVFGPPTMIFYGPDGQERTEYRLIGALGAKKFLTHVRSAFELPAI